MMENVKGTCVIEDREISRCPCLICIIKMICNETCEEFETFYKYIWERYNDAKEGKIYGTRRIKEPQL